MLSRYKIFLLIQLMFISAVFAGAPSLYCVFEGDTVSIQQGSSIDDIVLHHIMNLGDQGFPFTEAVLDGYAKIGDAEYFHYRIHKGETVRIDTVVFGDYSPREISLLSRYITFPESAKFHYGQVRDMIDELRSNTLLEVEERADIYGNGLRLYTKAKQDIRFDALIAYKQETNRQGVVGDISFDLINLGGLGRLASFHWSRPTLGVNAIDLSYTEPYILNKPFSVQASFSQRYQDSLYVKRDLETGIIYHINNRSHLKINYRNEQISTTNAGSDSGFVTQSRSGSDLLFQWTSKPGPVTGYAKAHTGIYFSVGRRVSRSEIDAKLRLRKSKLGLNLQLLGGIALSEEPIALYDQFKLGGAGFLRGAYFEQYMTNTYLGWKLETGYFFRNRLFFFYDGVIMNNPVPVSHHIGIGFSLPAGKNRVALGLGMNLSESIQQAKFHLSWNMGDS